MAARSAILLVALLLLAAPLLQPVDAVYLCVYCYRYSNGSRTRLTVVLNDSGRYTCKWKGKKKKLLHVTQDLMLCPERINYKGEQAPSQPGTRSSRPVRAAPLLASACIRLPQTPNSQLAATPRHLPLTTTTHCHL